MNVFLCHTPLHILITALESPKYANIQSLYLIVEDVPGLHTLAYSLLASAQAQFLMLPGTASCLTTTSAVGTQRENAKKIRAEISNFSPKHVFIFFDQRAEAQSLLNHSSPPNPKVTWLEDGITTYTVASPFSKPLRRLLRNKLLFDVAWKGSKWLGSHPAIDEVSCFFPELLRADLKNRQSTSLSRELNDKYLRSFTELYGPPRYGRPFGAIVVPHPDSGLSISQINEFILESLKFCDSKDIFPLLKIHPRDNTSASNIAKLVPNAHIIQQDLPLELILFIEKNARSIIGCRTSALHVTSALHPHIQTFYYEPFRAKDSEIWIRFFEKLSIQPLNRDRL